MPENTDFVFVNGKLIGAGGGYVLFCYFPANPVAGAEDIIDIVRNLSVAKDNPGLGACDTAPDSDAVFTVLKNGNLAGGFTFPAGTTTATPDFGSDLKLTTGDTLRVTAPSPQVGSIENVRIVLKTE